MKTLTATVTAIAGALTAIGAFVVIPGSAAMLIRLDRAALPPDLGVVTTLPDQFLLAFGLGYIVLPLLILVALSLAVTWLPGDAGAQNPALEKWTEWAKHLWEWFKSTARSGARFPAPPHDAQSLLLAAFALMVAFWLPVAVFGFWPPDWWWYLLSAASAIVFVVGCMLVAKLGNKRDVIFGCLVLVASLVFVGWTVAFAGVRAKFPQATVCLQDGGRLDGVLIGRTDDSYYVGEPEHRIALLGLDPTADELEQAKADPAAQATNQRTTQAKANIIGGLRAGGYGVISVAQSRDVTYQRTALVIAERRDGYGQLELPLKLDLPVLVVRTGDKPEAKRPRGATAISENNARLPSVLADRIESLLEAVPQAPDLDQPQRRIATVSASDVNGYRLGASGPCPVSDA